MSERPLPVTIIACLLVLICMAAIGALMSGSQAGHDFAETVTATYESSMLVWFTTVAIGLCGLGMLVGSQTARLIYVIYMAWGILEGFTMLDEVHYSIPVIIFSAVAACLLFTPASNDWFSRNRATA